MITYLSYCNWPWCCLACERHRKCLKFHIVRCDRQDVVAAQSSIPIQWPSSNFLIPLKKSFSRSFFSPLSSKFFFLQIVVIYFYGLIASLLISSTLYEQFFVLQFFSCGDIKNLPSSFIKLLLIWYSSSFIACI